MEKSFMFLFDVVTAPVKLSREEEKKEKIRMDNKEGIG